jgi:hypothetical protein
MNTRETSQEFTHDRRRFLSAAAMTIVSTNFSFAGSAHAQTNNVKAAATNAASRTSFPPPEAGCSG